MFSCDYDKGYLFGGDCQRGDVPFPTCGIREHMMSLCLIRCHLNLDHLVKRESAFLQCKDTVFAFVINKYFGGKFE